MTVDLAGRAPTEIFTLPFGNSRLEEEWLELAGRDPHSSYFQTPDWVLSWWEALAGRPPTRVAIWRDGGGALEALAAVSRQRHRVLRLLPLGTSAWTNTGSGVGAADHCGWPALESRRPDVRAWLRSHPGKLVLSNLDPDSGTSLVPDGAAMVAATVCPRLEIPDDLSRLGRSNHFRRHLRNYRRRLVDVGVSFETLGPDQMSNEVISEVIRLHQLRRAVTGWRSTFTGRRLAFHQQLLSRADKGRGPAATVAWYGGQVVGAIYGFWWQHTFAFYQGGWEDRWPSLSLGTVLNAEAIAECARAGGRIYDFLRGEEEYKLRFGASPRVDQTWVRPSGVGRLVTRLRSQSGRTP
ncbi:MAG: GNAT family N-acetyltransferase [Acidimicrobiia bacterium]